MFKKSHLYLLPLILFAFLIFPSSLLAKVGVGVGTGKIQVDEPLKPGVIHKLPSLSVFNTGDQKGRYTVEVEYHENQEERKPAKSWFSFKPTKFKLEPGQSQLVKITLTLPVKAKPGDYFAYLEGTPIQDSEGGQATVGIAAASKLYFKVAPANIFVGIYYRLLTFWQNNLPWTNIAAIVIAFSIIIALFRQHFDLQLNIAKKDTPENQEEETNEE